MARPNILTWKAEGFIQMMSNTEFHTMADLVLEKFAGSDGPGNIYAAQSANANYTAIGMWSDTQADAVGTESTTITVVDNTLYQDLTTNYGNFSDRPLTWDYTTSAIRQCTNTEIDSIADDIISHMVNNDAPGAYRIDTSTPAGTGTWAVVASFTDKSDTGTTVTTYNLYEKVAGATSLSQRPLRVQQPGVLQAMSNTQIITLAETVRARVVSSGIGTYALQETVPGTGTWSNVGSLVDTRRNIGDLHGNSLLSYVAEYSGYIAEYLVEQPSGGTYTAEYYRPVPANFFGPPVVFKDAQPYYGTPFFYGAPAYTGSGTYVGFVVYASYFGPVPPGEPGSYAVNAQGQPVIPGQYTGPGPFDFYGPEPVFYGPPATYIGPSTYYGPGGFAQAYAGTTVGTFTANYIASLTVQTPSSTIQTQTLWRRIA